MPRMGASLLALFAVLALVLSGVGLYGVMAYWVSRRRHEIGIRMALGARRQDVMSLVVRRGMLLAGTGLAIGLLISFFASRFLEGFLYQLSTTDPVTFIGVSGFLLLTAFVACYVPARRAMDIDPIQSLKYE